MSDIQNSIQSVSFYVISKKLGPKISLDALYIEIKLKKTENHWLACFVLLGEEEPEGMGALVPL